MCAVRLLVGTSVGMKCRSEGRAEAANLPLALGSTISKTAILMTRESVSMNKVGHFQSITKDRLHVSSDPQLDAQHILNKEVNPNS